MDVDATQALDYTDDETDDELASQQHKRPASAVYCCTLIL